MTEITQADRDGPRTGADVLLDAHFRLLRQGAEVAVAIIEADRAAVKERAERETVEKIVAWLRGIAPGGTVGLHEIAQCIEAGEHLQ